MFSWDYVHEKYADRQDFTRFAGWWAMMKLAASHGEKGLFPIGMELMAAISEYLTFFGLAAHFSPLDHISKAAGSFQICAQKVKKLTGYLGILITRKSTENSGVLRKLLAPEDPARKGAVQFIVY